MRDTHSLLTATPNRQPLGFDNRKTISRAVWREFLSEAGFQDKAEALDADPVIHRLLNPHAIVTRTDAVLGTSTGAGWAAELATTATGDYFSSFGTASAAAQLINAGTRVELGPRVSVSFPVRTAPSASSPWVEEGEPIPVSQAAFDAAVLGPTRKIATIFGMSGELARRLSGEAIFATILQENAALALDAGVFGTQAGSDADAEGLLYGLTSIAGFGDVAGDIAALLGALGAAGGSGKAAIICNPVEAAVVAVRLPNLAVPMWPTRGVPAGTVIALDPSAFVSAFGGIDIAVSKHATVHMSTVPLEIVDASETEAGPSRSFFQTDGLSVRMLADIAFVMRGANLVQMMSSVSWA